MIHKILRGTLAIFKRDIKKFLSSPFIILMTLLIPVMYLVVFGNAFGGTLSHVPVGVVQEAPPYNDTPLFTSATYQLNHINQGSQNDAEKLLDVTVYPDEVQAEQDLNNGKISAVIVFPSSVTNDNEVRVYVDSSDSVTPPAVEAAVDQVLLDIRAKNPVVINKIYGDITFLQFFGVAVIMMAIFTSTSFGGGIALIKDRENGIHEGYWSRRSNAPVSSWGLSEVAPSGRSSRDLPSSGSICWSRVSPSRVSRSFCWSCW